MTVSDSLEPQLGMSKNDAVEIQVACFRLGGELYALDVRRIKEVIRPQKVTPVPKAPAFIEGVINLRGMVIPVIDLRRRFALEPASDQRKARIIICVVNRRNIGLLVDQATEVCRFKRRDIGPPSPFIGGPETEFILGVCKQGEQLIMLLDLDRLLSDREAMVLAAVQAAEAVLQRH